MAGSGEAAIQPIPKDATWSLLLRKDDKVAYRGVVGSDPVGAPSAQMTYPAPNAAGLLVAVITHGVIVDSIRSGERDRQQKAADMVLSPYQGVLDDFRQQALMGRALERTTSPLGKKLLASIDEAGGTWIVESAPMFSMTQDRRAIVLDNLVSIYAPGGPSSPTLQNNVRVVSQPRDAEGIADFWSADQGGNLKDESAGLLAQSLDIVLSEVANEANVEGRPQKTVRYLEGGAEKMERAEIISEHCGRVVIRTLRGWLMSVPKAGAARTADKCGDPGAPSL